ncbi:MAG TPA: molybdenum cofactor guanylyltransferase [Edaphobacter sp.]
MMSRSSFAAYVLAGGHSKRMGQDKALLHLAGRTLIDHAVSKLADLTPDVYILGSRAELASFAPLVPDLHESCGPLGGMEAALTHTFADWALMIPVDMPFLPEALLRTWITAVLQQARSRLSFFIVDEVPQPALCMAHREVLPFLSTAIRQKRYKLAPVLEEAARALAHRESLLLNQVLLRYEWHQEEAIRSFARLAGDSGEGKTDMSPNQCAASHLWFENLNTPEQFNEAQLHLSALNA